MKALVTGATGFIGSHVAEMLGNDGFDVVCLMRKSSKNKWLDDSKYKFVEADISNKNSLKNILKDVDYVFHVAGLNFAKNKDDYQKVNYLGTNNLLEAVYEFSPNIKRFVYVSSQTASGPAESLAHPTTEESLRKPVTAYGLSKKLGEDAVLSYKGKLPVTILKPPAVFGPRDTAIFSLFQLMNFGLAAHFGLSRKYVSLIHVTDLARGIVQAARSEATVNETYFLTNDEFYHWDYISHVFKVQLNKLFYMKIKIPDPVVMSIGILNEKIFGLFGVHPKFDRDKAIDFTRQFWICSADKAKRDFDFRQHLSFEDAVKLTFEWYKENKWL